MSQNRAIRVFCLLGLITVSQINANQFFSAPEKSNKIKEIEISLNWGPVSDSENGFIMPTY